MFSWLTYLFFRMNTNSGKICVPFLFIKVLRNKMYKYILVVVDCFSKKLWAQPVKKKTKEATADAMEKVLDNMKSLPTMLVTDGGRGSN